MDSSVAGGFGDWADVTQELGSRQQLSTPVLPANMQKAQATPGCCNPLSAGRRALVGVLATLGHVTSYVMAERDPAWGHR